MEVSVGFDTPPFCHDTERDRHKCEVNLRVERLNANPQETQLSGETTNLHIWGINKSDAPDT